MVYVTDHGSGVADPVFQIGIKYFFFRRSHRDGVIHIERHKKPWRSCFQLSCDVKGGRTLVQISFDIKCGGTVLRVFAVIMQINISIDCFKFRDQGSVLGLSTCPTNIGLSLISLMM